MYISGSYVHMFDVRDGSLSVKRSAGNEGIGHLAVSRFELFFDFIEETRYSMRFRDRKIRFSII